jgi:DNA (cytosine-5)-methyltransferase 1
MKPIVLDLFSGAGGAAMGYHRAGFDVVGVDIEPQPRYPFDFIEADWREPLRFLPGLWEREGRPYLIHASPPCQRYSTMTKRWARSDDHPDLIEPVRDELIAIGAPFVIENVVGAPLINPIRLCGSSFGLAVRRHRLFELSEPPLLVPPCAHTGPALQVNGNPGGSSRRDPNARFGGVDEWRAGMGIEWMTAAELREAIPPAYTEWIGLQLVDSLEPMPVPLPA